MKTKASSYVSVLLCCAVVTFAQSVTRAAEAGARRIASNWQRPLEFEPNRGQAHHSVEFVGRGRGGVVFLNSRELNLSIPGGRLSIGLDGARADATATGIEPLPGVRNYLLGSDLTQWRTGIPTFGKVLFAGVYPGVDLLYYAAEEGIEFDFRLAAGVKPRAIDLTLAGADSLSIRGRDVEIHTPGNRHLTLRCPTVYQETPSGRRTVDARYVRRGAFRVGIEVGPYDTAQSLVIDPVLTYATYVGGSGAETLNGMALDTAGNIYLTGRTSSLDFPVRNGVQQAPGGVFITKLNASGTAVLYSTYLGGPAVPPPNADGPSSAAIAVDGGGNAFVVGQTREGEWPLVNALQPRFGGGYYNAFVAKLDATGGRLLFSTYLGGQGALANAIALDAAGNPVVAGNANVGFPTTPGALEPTSGGAGGFVCKLNASGSALMYSTYLGAASGAGIRAVVVDAAGNAYLSGGVSRAGFPVTPGAFQTTMPSAPGVLFPSVGFVAKLNAAGSSLLYSTLLGGVGYNDCTALAIDAQGSAFVTGMTTAADFPVTTGAFQTEFKGKLYCIGGSHCVGKSATPNSFVARLNAAGTGLIYSTFLGGSGREEGGDAAAGIVLDSERNAYVAGMTASDNFPLKSPIQSVRNCAGCTGGSPLTDAFVSVLDASGSQLLFSTYVGGSQTDIARSIVRDPAGGLWLAGTTFGGSSGVYFNDFPTTGDAWKPAMTGEDFRSYSADGFLARISFQPSPVAVPVITSASIRAIDPAANQFSATIHGTNFTPSSQVRVDGVARGSQFVDSTQLTVSGIPIQADEEKRTAVGVLNLLPDGQIGGISNSVGLNAPLCAIAEPGLTLTLGPGFYIVDVRIPDGTTEGFWGLEALIPAGAMAGGLHFGGGLQEFGTTPSFGAFYIPSTQSVRVQLDAQPYPGGDRFALTAQLLNARGETVGARHVGLTSIAFSTTLDAGFYVLAVESEENASRATFQLSVLTDVMSGGLDVGGYLPKGVSGFGAFYLSDRQDVRIRTLGRPSYGAAGAPCLQLTVFDGNRKPIAASP